MQMMLPFVVASWSVSFPSHCVFSRPLSRRESWWERHELICVQHSTPIPLLPSRDKCLFFYYSVIITISSTFLFCFAIRSLPSINVVVCFLITVSSLWSILRYCFILRWDPAHHKQWKVNWYHAKSYFL